jgi:hypothetical protein
VVRGLGLFVLGLVLGWTIAAAALFVWPPSHDAARVDAAVVLAVKLGYALLIKRRC